MSNPAELEEVFALEDLYDIPDERKYVPAVFIGDVHLMGGNEIPARLPSLVEQHLQQGVLACVDLAAPAPTASPTAPPATASPIPTLLPTASLTTAPPLYLAYFSKVGCSECDRTEYELAYFQDKYPQLTVREFPIEDEEARLLAQALALKYDLPPKLHLGTPAVFIGADYFVDKAVTHENIQASIERHLATGAPPPWENVEAYLAQARASIAGRFQTFSALAIFGVGLIDGVNPCAFATLVFFISYLSIAGRKGREIIYVGAAFAAAIFLSYFAIGVGLFNFVLHFVSPALSRGLTMAIAGLAVVLGILSLRDAYLMRQGKSGDMALAVPHNLRLLINKVVRTQARTENYIIGAFVAGLAISVLEAVCTGQTYLPTITAVLANPGLRLRAYLLLTLYNLGFIVPLVIVFLLAYRGTTSQSLANVLKKHGAAIKVVLGIFFLGLAAFLFYSL